ncbi:MAG: lanthionine synthetase C family protein, partial [Pyrinomonadaceae bacterium]
MRGKVTITPEPLSLSSARNSWHPILDGALREEALAVVKEIAASLPGHVEENHDASLASGQAGLALTYAYLARANLSSDQNAVGCLERAIQIISSETVWPSLYGGFTGVVWTLAHLQKQLFDSEAKDIYKTTDPVLYKYSGRSSWDGNYDLIDGLVGIGVYALERLPDPSAIKCLMRVIDRLEEMAVCQSNGITFPTYPSLLTDKQREQHPNGYYDLGMAHGIAGVVAFLGVVCATGIASARARVLLDGAVKWLLRQKMESGRSGCFPYYVGPNIKRKSARLAWCYGDAGIASALLVAARCVKEPEWEREALKIARHAASRSLEQTAVVDAALCHGAAGLGHIFNRIFHATGKTWSKKAATFWFERTLGLR